MKNHTLVYFRHFGIMWYPDGTHDWIGCEVCGDTAVDCHHIENRGMGGSKSKDHIDNLMMLCRMCHELYGDKPKWIEFLKDRHGKKLGYEI